MAMQGAVTGKPYYGSVSSETERNLWRASPLLGQHGGQYVGHLFTEVWSDGFVCVATTDRNFIPAAAAALATADPNTELSSPIPAGADMMDRPGVTFLGRAIVEFWSNRPPVASASGTDVPQIIELSRTRLEQVG